MTIPADKLDAALLAILRGYNGRNEVAMNGIFGWCDLVNNHLGEIVDPLDAESALRRLRDIGHVRLRKYDPEQNVRHEYVNDEPLGSSKLEVTITDEGRRYWDVPRRLVGFQKPA